VVKFLFGNIGCFFGIGKKYESTEAKESLMFCFLCQTYTLHMEPPNELLWVSVMDVKLLQET